MVTSRPQVTGSYPTLGSVGVLDEVQVLPARTERVHRRRPVGRHPAAPPRPSPALPRYPRRAPGTRRRASASRRHRGADGSAPRPVAGSRSPAASTAKPGPASSTNARIASSGIPASTTAFDAPGVGPSGSMCSPASDATGTRPKVSISGPRSRSAERISLLALVRGQHRAVDHHELATAERLRDVGQRRQVEHPERWWSPRRGRRRPRPANHAAPVRCPCGPRPSSRRTRCRTGRWRTPAP